MILSCLIVVAAAVIYIRQGYVAERRRVHRLAERTLDLTQRITPD